MLQEMKRALAAHKFKGTFVRVAAPTGCAAFNVRFAASTLHRLFEMRNPRKWSELSDGGATLLHFQEKMRDLHLVVIDEISMVGKQMMGKISSRCRQAKPGEQNPTDDVLGGLFCIGVGDPRAVPADLRRALLRYGAAQGHRQRSHGATGTVLESRQDSLRYLRRRHHPAILPSSAPPRRRQPFRRGPGIQQARAAFS